MSVISIIEKSSDLGNIIYSVSGLPSEYKWSLFTYSDSDCGRSGGTRTGAYNVENGVDIDLGTNTFSCMLTRSPEITDISINKNESTSTNTAVYLTAVFHCRDLFSKLNVKHSENMRDWTYLIEIPGINGEYYIPILNASPAGESFELETPN